MEVGDLSEEYPVTAVVENAAGEQRTVRAKYVIGADGGASAVRKSLRIAMEGTSAPRPNFNVVFRSRELADRVRVPAAVQYWIVGEVSGMLGRLDLTDRWWTIVQGVDHVVPVDMYLPGCPPRPEMLIDAMFKLRKQKVAKLPIGVHEIEQNAAAEREALEAPATHEMKGLLR